MKQPRTSYAEIAVRAPRQIADIILAVRNLSAINQYEPEIVRQAFTLFTLSLTQGTVEDKVIDALMKALEAEK
jgi:hypothetical protein